jgi:hypothetical protein
MALSTVGPSHGPPDIPGSGKQVAQFGREAAIFSATVCGLLHKIAGVVWCVGTLCASKVTGGFAHLGSPPYRLKRVPHWTSNGHARVDKLHSLPAALTQHLAIEPNAGGRICRAGQIATTLLMPWEIAARLANEQHHSAYPPYRKAGLACNASACLVISVRGDLPISE